MIEHMAKHYDQYCPVAHALDVVVEGDAEGLYYLFIERRLDGVSISGDRALLDHLIDAAPQPIVA
jgi:hypothetical protein